MANVLSFAAHLQKKSSGDSLSAPVRSDDGQLALSFFAPHNLVFVFAEYFSRRQLFAAFAEQTNPHLIVDLRVAPRLDFIASTRAQALHELELQQISYLDLRGRLEQSTPSDLEYFEVVAHEIRTLLDQLKVSHRPILAFFDDAILLRKINVELNRSYDVVVAEQRYIEAAATNSDKLRM